MFVLAVCYDAQFPTDDGSCATYSTRSSCLHEKSPFDAEVSVCAWVAEDSSDNSAYVCEYVPANPTVNVRVPIYFRPD